MATDYTNLDRGEKRAQKEDWQSWHGQELESRCGYTLDSLKCLLACTECFFKHYWVVT